MKVKKLAVFTDQGLLNLPVMKTVRESLEKQNINFHVYDRVTVEPTDVSFKEAIDWARSGQYDSYLAVGMKPIMYQ